MRFYGGVIAALLLARALNPAEGAGFATPGGFKEPSRSGNVGGSSYNSFPVTYAPPAVVSPAPAAITISVPPIPPISLLNNSGIAAAPASLVLSADVAAIPTASLDVFAKSNAAGSASPDAIGTHSRLTSFVATVEDRLSNGQSSAENLRRAADFTEPSSLNPVLARIKAALSVDHLPGKFIAVDGLVAAGKTTRIEDLSRYFAERNQKLIVTNRGSSWIFGPLIQLAEKARVLGPNLSNFLYFWDSVYRLKFQILPALKRGEAVVADRWYATDLARTALRANTETQQRAQRWFSALPSPPTLFLAMSPEKTIDRRQSHLTHADALSGASLFGRLKLSWHRWFSSEENEDRFRYYELYQDQRTLKGDPLSQDPAERFRAVQHALYAEYLSMAANPANRIVKVDLDTPKDSAERKASFFAAVEPMLADYFRGRDLRAELNRRDIKVLFMDYDGNFADDGSEPSAEALRVLESVVDRGIQVDFVSMGVGERLARNLRRLPARIRGRVRIVSEGGVVGYVGEAPLGATPAYEVKAGIPVSDADRSKAESALDETRREFQLPAATTKKNSLVGYGIKFARRDDSLAQRFASVLREKLAASGVSTAQVIVSAGMHVDIRFADKRSYILQRLRELGLTAEQAAVSGDSAFPGGGDAAMFAIPGLLPVYSGPERSDVPVQYYRTEKRGPEGTARFLNDLATSARAREGAASHRSFLLGVLATQFARFSIPATIPLVFSEILKAPQVGYIVLALAAVMEMIGTIVGYGFSARLQKMLKVGTAVQALLLLSIPLILGAGYWSVPLIAAVYILNPILFAMNDFSAETMPALLTRGDDAGLRKLNAWQSFAIEAGAFCGPAAIRLLLGFFGLSLAGLVAASAVVPAALVLAVVGFRLMPTVIQDAPSRPAASQPRSGAEKYFGWLAPVAKMFAGIPGLVKYPLLFLSLGAYVFFALPPMRQILPSAYAGLLLHNPLQAPWLLSVFGIGGALGSLLFRVLHQRLSVTGWVSVGALGTAVLAASPFLSGFWPMMTAFLIFAALNAMARAETKSAIQAIARKEGHGIVELSNAFMRICFKVVSMIVITVPGFMIAHAQSSNLGGAAHPFAAFAVISGGLFAMAAVQFAAALRMRRLK